MTNIYDVLGKMHVKATANLKMEIADDLEKEDPPAEEAKAVLEGDTKIVSESADESTKGNEKKRSSKDNKQDL